MSAVANAERISHAREQVVRIGEELTAWALNTPGRLADLRAIEELVGKANGAHNLACQSLFPLAQLPPGSVDREVVESRLATVQTMRDISMQLLPHVEHLEKTCGRVEGAESLRRHLRMCERVLGGGDGLQALSAQMEPRFRQLVEQWRYGRGPTSSSAKMAAHPAYREIVGMGEAAIPLLLAELERRPDHWFQALHELTGADPVPKESQGRIREMAAAWLAWGREHGYAC